MAKTPRIPNLLSLACLALGFASLAASAQRDWTLASRLLLVAAAADSLAGRRVVKRRAGTPMGLELDSLASLLSFGVAPVVLAYEQSLRRWQPGGWILAGGLVAVCALRLARDNQDKPENPSYRGLPVPVFGAVAVVAARLFPQPGALAALMAWMGLLMVVRLPYRRMGFKGLAAWVAPLMVLAALLPPSPAGWGPLLGALLIYALVGHTSLLDRVLMEAARD